MNALGLTHAVTAWRRRWYDAPHRQRRLSRPVISVGNIAFGGRGKTPTVAHLARLLVEAGERPSILTRGYAREQPQDGVVVVSDGTHCRADLARSGDEPLMLARSTPGAAVLVSEDRALAGALAERAFDVTVHLLDDGFQHVQLARDVDLVLVAPGDLSGAGGALRERRESLRYADAVLTEEPAAAVEGPRQFFVRRRLGQPVALEPDREWPAKPRPAVTVAGIAEPERFARALVPLGWPIARSLTFRDHHRYTLSDLADIAAVVRETSASVVLTTEKDAMRLLPLRPLPFVAGVVPLDVVIEPAAEFREWILGRLREARA